MAAVAVSREFDLVIMGREFLMYAESSADVSFDWIHQTHDYERRREQLRVQVCGVARAMLPGQQLGNRPADRCVVNVRTVRGRPSAGRARAAA